MWGIPLCLNSKEKGIMAIILNIKKVSWAEFFVFPLSFQFLKDSFPSTDLYWFLMIFRTPTIKHLLLKCEVLILTMDLFPSLESIWTYYYLFMLELKAQVAFSLICQLNNERHLNQKLINGKYHKDQCALSINSWLVNQSSLNVYSFTAYCKSNGF